MEIANYLLTCPPIVPFVNWDCLYLLSKSIPHICSSVSWWGPNKRRLFMGAFIYYLWTYQSIEARQASNHQCFFGALLLDSLLYPPLYARNPNSYGTYNKYNIHTYIHIYRQVILKLKVDITAADVNKSTSFARLVCSGMEVITDSASAWQVEK